MQERRFVLFSRLTASLHDKRPVNLELGARYGLLGGRVKPLHTPLPARQGIVERNTGQKTSQCQKRVCYLAGAWTIPQSSWQRSCVLLDVEHVPLNAFSYSWSSEKKRVRRRVRPCYLLQSRLLKEERSLSTGSLFSLLFLFWKIHLLANLDALKMLLNCPLPEVTWKSVDLRVLDRMEGTVDGTGEDMQTLCWNSAEKTGESPFFFFGWLAKINAGT